jgi:membrane protein DedA with SNARE-associated domain
MTEIEELIAQYGDLFYLMAFLFAALEGEIFVIFAGFAAQRGHLGIVELILAVWLGSTFGDQICFWLGRHFGTHIFKYTPKLKAGIMKAVGRFEKYAILFIMSYRFMYGVRNVSGIAIGMSHFPWQKFAFWNVIAAFFWAVIFSGFGYFFGGLIS